MLYRDAVGKCDDGKLAEAEAMMVVARRTLGFSADGSIEEHSGVAPEQRMEIDRLGVRLLISLSLTRYELHTLDAGLMALEHASYAAAEARLTDLEVLIRCQRGVLLLRSGRLTEALSELDRSVELIGDALPIEQCKIYMNRADTHQLLGRIEPARLDCAAALRIADVHHLDEFSFRNTHNYGFILFLSGDLPAALATMPEVSAASSDYGRGVVGMDRARVLISAGLFDEAGTTLDAAIAALTRTDLTQLLAEAELARAEVSLLSGHRDHALALASSAGARSRQRDHRRNAALADFTVMRIRSLDLPPPPDLVAAAEAHAAVLQKLHLPDQAKACRLMAIQASINTAEPRDPGAVRARPGEPINVRLRMRTVRAEAAFAGGLAREGRRHARLGLRELLTYQNRFGSVDLKASSAIHGVGLAAIAIREEIARNRPAAVFAWVDQFRSISTRIPEVQPPNDSELAALLTRLRWVNHQLHDPQPPTHLEWLRRQKTEAESEIKHRSWTRRGGDFDGLSQPDRAAASALDPGVTLIAYFVLDDYLWAAVRNSDTWALHHLGPLEPVNELLRRVRADLDIAAFDQVPAQVRAVARTSLRRSLERLDTLLLDGLPSAASAYVIMPPGRLTGLPWGLLPRLRGKAVALNSSTAGWLAAQNGARAGDGPVTVIAGPGIPRSSSEVRSVTAQWPGATSLQRDQATGEAALGAMDGARLVHVAAHGHHQSDSPLFSSIDLYDGPLVAYDLDRLRRPPEQVVLSACDLGQGSVRDGNEPLGLTRALLHCGTSTVISGVAKVSDLGASELMVGYHHRLALGTAPAYALAQALAEADEPLPFVCFGAGW